MKDAKPKTKALTRREMLRLGFSIQAGNFAGYTCKGKPLFLGGKPNGPLQAFYREHNVQEGRYGIYRIDRLGTFREEKEGFKSIRKHIKSLLKEFSGHGHSN